MLRKWLLLILSITTSALVFGQTIYGKIVDEETKESIPFVNIYLKKAEQGTTTNLDGFFRLNYKEKNDSLLVSSVGFETKRLFLKDIISIDTITIELSTIKSSLDVVVVKAPKIRPSHRIMMQVIKNKKLNDPNRIQNYSAKQYIQNVFFLDNLSANYKDKRLFKRIKVLQDYVDSADGNRKIPLILQETMADYYQKNGISHFNVKSQNKVGVSSEFIDMGNLAGKGQANLDVYQNNMKIFDKTWGSPISNSWKTIYKYLIEDTVVINNDSCYVLSYRPQMVGQSALTGEIAINMKTYALVRASGKLPENTNINFVKAFQFSVTYAKKDGFYVVQKEHNNSRISLSDKDSSKLAGLYIEKTTYHYDHNLNENFDTFSTEVLAADMIQKNDPEFWEKNRPFRLEDNALKMYELNDTLKKNKRFRRSENLMYMVSTGFYPTKYIDIGNAYKVVSFNRYQKFRLRFDLRTTLKMSRKVRLQGFAGYGFGDKRWIYGGEIMARTNPKRFGMFRIGHEYDMKQLGVSSSNQRVGATFGAILRTAPMYNIYYVKRAYISWENEWLKDFTTKIEFNITEYEKGSLEPYPIRKGEIYEDRQRLRNAEARIQFRYAPDQKIIKGRFERTFLGSLKPVLTLDYAFSPKRFMRNPFQYHRIEISLLQEPGIGILGRLKYKVFAGAVLGDAPYVYAKVHEGNQSYYLQKYAFNLMRYFEFSSDRYVGFQFEHHLDGLFFNLIPWVRRAKLRLLWTSNFVIGSLSKRNQELIKLPVDTKSLNGRPYAEVGVGVENIFKVFRLDFVWRLTHRDRIGINNSWGVMGRVQVLF